MGLRTVCTTLQNPVSKKNVCIKKKYLTQVVAQQLGQDLCNWSPGSAANLQLKLYKLSFVPQFSHLHLRVD